MSRRKQCGRLDENPLATQSRNKGRAARTLCELKHKQRWASWELDTHLKWRTKYPGNSAAACISYSLGVCDTDQPLWSDPDYRGSPTDEQLPLRPELALPWEQRVKVLRAVTAPSPERKRGWRERERNEPALPLETCPFCFSETRSALLKRCQWRLAQALAAETFTSCLRAGRERQG